MTYEEFKGTLEIVKQDTLPANHSIALPSNENYKTIEYVYTWHPIIDNVNGKYQIALLYIHFGMKFINTMVPLAQKAEELDKKRIEAQSDLKAICDAIDNLI